MCWGAYRRAAHEYISTYVMSYQRCAGVHIDVLHMNTYVHMSCHVVRKGVLGCIKACAHEYMCHDEDLASH